MFPVKKQIIEVKHAAKHSLYFVKFLMYEFIYLDYFFTQKQKYSMFFCWQFL